MTTTEDRVVSAGILMALIGVFVFFPGLGMKLMSRSVRPRFVSRNDWASLTSTEKADAIAQFQANRERIHERSTSLVILRGLVILAELAMITIGTS